MNGEWVKSKRKERKLTQAELAKLLNTNQAIVSMLETGKRDCNEFADKLLELFGKPDEPIAQAAGETLAAPAQEEPELILKKPEIEPEKKPVKVDPQWKGLTVGDLVCNKSGEKGSIVSLEHSGCPRVVVRTDKSDKALFVWPVDNVEKC